MTLGKIRDIWFQCQGTLYHEAWDLWKGFAVVFGCMFKVFKSIYLFLLGRKLYGLGFACINFPLDFCIDSVDSEGIAYFGGASYLHVSPVHFANFQ